jgi:lysophospholipase L1-like esterase
MRIVAFGDSITYGNGSTDKLGFIVKLERKLKEFNSSSKIINRGLNAESTDWAILRVKRVVEEEEPKIMLIMEGINDIILHKKEDPVSNLRKLVQTCKKNNVKPYISTILPTQELFSLMGRMSFSVSNIINKKYPRFIKSNNYYSEQIKIINQKIKLMAEEEGIICVDLFAEFSNLDLNKVLNDKIHPNDSGYEIIANKWAEVLKHELVESNEDIKHIEEETDKWELKNES